MSSDSTPQPEQVSNAESVPTTGTLCIIAGSRSTADVLSGAGLQALLTAAIETADFDPAAIVSGTANGVDAAGEQWAADRDLPVAEFPAPWDDTDHPDAVVREGQHGTYDARAGPRRNRWMAEYAAAHADRGVLLAIIDYPSSGTESMIELGRELLGDDNVYVVPIGDIDDADARERFAPVLHQP